MQKQFDVWRGLAIAAVAGVAIAAAGCQSDSNADANGGFASGGATATQASPGAVPSGNQGTSGTQTTGYNTTGNANKQAGNEEPAPTVDEPEPQPVNIPPPPPGYQKSVQGRRSELLQLDPLFRPGSMQLNASYGDGAPSARIQDSGG